MHDEALLAAFASDEQPLRVLVVEDDEMLLETLVSMLDEEGCDAIGVATLQEGLEILRDRPPRVVLTDKNLPDGSGLDLMREGRRLAPGTEFILITGHATLESALAAMELGAVAYLPKPLRSLADVVRRVRAAAERARVVELNQLLTERLRVVGTRLDRAHSESELMARVVAEASRGDRTRLRSFLDDLVAPLARVEEDLGRFSALAREAAEGRAFEKKLSPELDRLRLLEQTVRRLLDRAQEASRAAGDD